MDCLEFRRRLGADPQARDPDMAAHRVGCAACAAAAARAQRFEQALLDALNVPVPAHLSERVLFAKATAERHQFVRRRRMALAIAASLILAVGIGGVTWRQSYAQSLPVLAIAHMPGEISTFALTRPVADQAVIAGFAARQVALKGFVPPNTTYVQDCPVGAYATVHLVSRIDGQSVAMLYFPHKRAERKDFNRDGWQGREVPLAQGTLVMLTNRGGTRSFDQLEWAWRAAIDGPGEQRLISQL